MSFCNGNFQKRISRVEISRNFNGNFQGENFHFGNFHSLVPCGSVVCVDDVRLWPSVDREGGD